MKLLELPSVSVSNHIAGLREVCFILSVIVTVTSWTFSTMGKQYNFFLSQFSIVPFDPVCLLCDNFVSLLSASVASSWVFRQRVLS